MTVLIVWLHVSANYDVPPQTVRISILSVPCFFALSSFLYFSSYDFNQSWGCYKSKVISRTKSLLVPFLVFNLIGLIFSIVLYRFHPVLHHPLDGITSITDVLEAIYDSKFNGPLWYLRSLYAFILFAPILGYVIRYSKWSILLLLPIYYCCQNIRYFYFPYWMVDIFTGAYIAIYYKDITQSSWLKSEKVQWGGLIISALALLCITDEYLLRAIAPVCMIAIANKIPLFPQQLTTIIAPYSMLIYCLHLPASRITSKIPTLMHIENPLISLITATVFTVGLIMICGMALKRCPRLWSFLTGGR